MKKKRLVFRLGLIAKMRDNTGIKKKPPASVQGALSDILTQQSKMGFTTRFTTHLVNPFLVIAYKTLETPKQGRRLKEWLSRLKF